MKLNGSSIRKICLCVSFLATAATVYLTHSGGQLYPVFNIGSAIVFSSLIILTVAAPPRSYTTAAATIFVVLLLRLHVVWFRPTPQAIDPYQFIGAIERLLARGPDSINIGFYEQARIFFLEAGMFARISGLSVQSSYVIHSLVVAIGFPLVGAVAYTYLSPDRTVQGVTTTVVLLAAVDRLASYVYHPIPQMYALVLLVLVLAAFARILSSSSRTIHKKFFYLLAPLIVAIFFTHKLPQFLLGATLVTITMYAMITNRVSLPLPTAATDSKRILRLTLIVGVFIVAQSAIVTNLMALAGGLVVTSIQNMSLQGIGSASPDIQTAAGYSSRIVGSYLDPTTATARGSLLTVLIGIPATIYTFYRNRRVSAQVFAVFGGVTMLLLIVGMSERERFVTSAMPIFVIILAFVAVHFYRRASPKRNVVITSILVLFVLVNAFSAPAVPGYADRAELHRSQGDVDGLDWAMKYSSGDVYTDKYTSWIHYRKSLDPNDGINSANEWYFTGGFATACLDGILHRTGRDTHWNLAMYQITWDVESELSATYNRVYQNPDAVYYTSTCT